MRSAARTNRANFGRASYMFCSRKRNKGENDSISSPFSSTSLVATSIMTCLYFLNNESFSQIFITCFPTPQWLVTATERSDIVMKRHHEQFHYVKRISFSEYPRKMLCSGKCSITSINKEEGKVDRTETTYFFLGFFPSYVSRTELQLHRVWFLE